MGMTPNWKKHIFKFHMAKELKPATSMVAGFFVAVVKTGGFYACLSENALKTVWQNC